MTIDDTIIIEGFSGAFAALTGTIVAMWWKLSAEHESLRKRADACETSREEMFRQISELRGDSDLLERCPSPRCPLRPSVPTQPKPAPKPLALPAPSH